MKKAFAYLLSVTILLGLLVPIATTSLAENAMPELKNGTYQIETYEQLRNVAAVSYNGINAKLIKDILCTNNENDYMIQVQACGRMTLDLNGRTLSRSAYSLDECLISVETEALLTVYDSSKEQTGTCIFESKASLETSTVILNNGGQLCIESGNYILKTVENNTVSGVITGNSGYTYIEGGNFDGTQATAGVGIRGHHWGYVYESPVFIISGGKFYGKGGISLSPFGDYLKYGSFYPTAFILGGEFHLVDPNKGNGFAYCNNGWGDIFLGGGTFPAYSLNGARDYTFGEGCVKELVNLENPAGINSTYYQVTPSTMIFDTVSQPDIQEVLLERLMRQWLNKYKKRSALVENNPLLFEKLNIPRSIYVDRTKEHPFELQAKGAPKNCTYRWLVADSYEDEAPWTHLNQYDNSNLWVTRPEEATTKYYRLEVTPEKGEVYTDEVLISFEASAKTTVLGEISFHINTLEDAVVPTSEIYISPATLGGYEIEKIQWHDKTSDTILKAKETFVAGHTYEAKITLKANEGFAFSVIPPTHVLCNGKTCQTEETNSNTPVSAITLVYDAGTCPTTVSTANLTICPPVAGTERDLYPQIGNQNFTINSITWFNVSESREMDKGELFANGHQYSVEIWLEIDDGFSFANNTELSQVKATVNGNKAPVTTAYEQSLVEMIVVNYDFGICDSVINQVNVVDVYQPFPGESPVSYAWSPSDKYAVASVFWYGPNGQLSDSDVFEEGISYEIVVQLSPLKHGSQILYTFDPDTRAYINEMPASRVELSSNSLLIYADYLCVPKPQPVISYGDVNEDGKVDAKDALEILKASVGKVELTDSQKLVAEVDGKEGIGAKDALEVLKYTVKKIEQFPVEKNQ